VLIVIRLQYPDSRSVVCARYCRYQSLLRRLAGEASVTDSFDTFTIPPFATVPGLTDLSATRIAPARGFGTASRYTG
jgi:hypothetical protein